MPCKSYSKKKMVIFLIGPSDGGLNNLSVHIVHSNFSLEWVENEE
jgi:hypothetical protein